MWIIDYVYLKLYANNFTDTKMKGIYIWGYANAKGLNITDSDNCSCKNYSYRCVL
jgi:hypothetical protein